MLKDGLVVTPSLETISEVSPAYTLPRMTRLRSLLTVQALESSLHESEWQSDPGPLLSTPVDAAPPCGESPAHHVSRLDVVSSAIGEWGKFAGFVAPGEEQLSRLLCTQPAC